jgi:hypothetical protein
MGSINGVLAKLGSADDHGTRLIARFFEERHIYQRSELRFDEALSMLSMLVEERRLVRRREPPLYQLPPGDYQGRGQTEAARLTDQIIQAIMQQDDEGRRDARRAETSAGPAASYPTPSSATVPWLLAALQATSHDMRAYLGVSCTELRRINDRAELADRLWLAAHYQTASVEQLLALSTDEGAIAATLGFMPDDLERMVSFASLHRQCNRLLEGWFANHPELEPASVEPNIRRLAVAEAVAPVLSADPRLKSAGFAGWDSFCNYPIGPSWNEDRYGWQRLAVERATAASTESGTSLDELLRGAAGAGDGWVLAIDRMRREIARDLQSEEEATAPDDELCWRAARRRRADRAFAPAVVRRFRVLRAARSGERGQTRPVLRAHASPRRSATAETSVKPSGPLPASPQSLGEPSAAATRDLQPHEAVTRIVSAPQQVSDPPQRLDEIASAILDRPDLDYVARLSPYQRLLAGFVRVDVFGQLTGPLRPSFAAKLSRASTRAERLIRERLRDEGRPVWQLGAREWNIASVGGWDGARARGYQAYGMATELDGCPMPRVAIEVAESVYDRAVLLCGPADRFLSVVGRRDLTRPRSSLRRSLTLAHALMAPPSVLDESFRARCYRHTAEWYNRLAADSEALRAYFALIYPNPDSATEMESLPISREMSVESARGVLQRLAVVPPESQEAACALAFADEVPKRAHLTGVAERLRQVIEADYRLLVSTAYRSAQSRVWDPRRGFFTLPFEVVYALRAEGLRWCACDLGSDSGDLQRFDDGWS